jgi:hypothetical protein
MSYGEECCRIEKVANGFTVSMKDPDIVKANQKRNSGKSNSLGMWKDPHKSFVFDSVEEVLTFLQKTLPKALPSDEFGSTFTQALKETDSDD